MKESNYHPEWQNARIEFILGLYEPEFFKGKRILELGAFNGYIGNYFAEVLGAEVTSVDGRGGNVTRITQDYPLLNAKCFNLDTDQWEFGEYDIIINFGLYYHLENYHEQHLINCINNCKLMFFETVVYDSYDSELFFRKEYGSDQSLTDNGGNPSTSFVEDIFTKTNCKYTKYSDEKLNAGGHVYDWEDMDSKVLDGCARRFWIVETKND